MVKKVGLIRNKSNYYIFLYSYFYKNIFDPLKCYLKE